MKAVAVTRGTKSLKKDIPAVIRKIRTNIALERTTLLLVGSMARGTETRWSDIDFIAISECRLPTWIPPLNVHLQFDTRTEFVAGITGGDDFRAWALRYGKVIVDDGWWANLPREELMKLWPKWEPKVVHGSKNLRMSLGLAQTGDVVSAWREMIYAVSHIARAILIAKQVFPLSRPELSDQLTSIGEIRLAKTLGQLLVEEPNLNDIISIGHDLEHRIRLMQ